MKHSGKQAYFCPVCGREYMSPFGVDWTCPDCGEVLKLLKLPYKVVKKKGNGILKKMIRVFDTDGNLMPDKLMDVIRWRERRGMTDQEIAQLFGVDVGSLQRAVDAAQCNGQWNAAKRILIRKRVLPDPDKPLKPKIVTYTE